MVEPALKEQILEDLNRLSPSQQLRAAEWIHQLVSPAPNGTSGRDLLPFYGTLDDQSAEEMTAAIEDGCERVDKDAW